MRSSLRLTELEHLIYRPRELYVDDRPEGLVSFDVIGAPFRDPREC
jgi:hypothetical protein